MPRKKPDATQHYVYVHTNTEGLTGYFACEPSPCPSMEYMLKGLAKRPLDTFLRSYIIRALMTLEDAAFDVLWQQAFEEEALPVQACLAERCIAKALPSDIARLQALSPEKYAALCEATSLPDLAWFASADYDNVRAWNAFIRPNILEHRSLPFYDIDANDDDPDNHDDDLIALPCDMTSLKAVYASLEAGRGAIGIIHARMQAEDTQAKLVQWERPPAEETASLALKRLEDAGIVAGPEARHEATLSPVGLLRPWRVSMQVKQGRHDYTVLGQGTTYGRGLSIATARASCLMEMVERASAYVSVDTAQNGQSFVTERARPTPLIKARYSELSSAAYKGQSAFDPNSLPLEVPYANQSIHWIEGFDFDGASVLVPFQAVCVFANLDEPDLFMMPSSTGLATGATVEDAVVVACMEIFERDAEAALPWERSQCFSLQSDDSTVNTLLNAYASQGIHVFFRDMTGDVGVPAYQACVRYADGRMARGAAAHLSGKKALLAALTETPYSFRHVKSAKEIYAAPSAPALSGLPVRRFEDLPDMTLANPTRHLALIKEILHKEILQSHDVRPVWVPLTRADLIFPVVRVLMPHMALSADVDSFAKPHPHFMAQYSLRN